jgi:hypothetical protein
MDFCSGFGQPLDDCSPNSLCAASDKGDFTVE